jgi:hypothetical protein
LTKTARRAGPGIRVSGPAALMLLAACSSDPAALKSEAGASLNTAVVTLDAWLAHDAPGHYASRTLDAAETNLQATITQIEGLEPTAAADLAQWALPLQAAREEIAAAANAIGNDNAAVARAHRDALAAEVQRLAATPPPPKP